MTHNTTVVNDSGYRFTDEDADNTTNDMNNSDAAANKLPMRKFLGNTFLCLPPHAASPSGAPSANAI